MASRPVFLPELGQFFQQLREQKGWKQAYAGSLAERRGLSGLSRQVLLRLEAGRTKNPEPNVLRSIATLYQVPYEELLARFWQARYGVSPEHVTAARARLEPTPATVEGEGPSFTRVPLMADPIAAGQPLRIDDGDIASYLAFEESIVRRWHSPVCVRIGPREESMLPLLQPGQIVVLDRGDAKRLAPKPTRVYAVRVDEGATLKRLEIVEHREGRVLALISENPDKAKYPTRLMSIVEAVLTEIVIGEVVWHGGSYGGRGR